MEKQIGHIVKLAFERPPGTLPSNTEVNPREHINVISVRYNKEVPNNDTMLVVQEKNPKKEEVMDLSIVSSKKFENAQGEMKKKTAVEAYKPSIPYLEAHVSNQSEDEMRRLIEIFKQLKNNLPLCDLLL